MSILVLIGLLVTAVTLVPVIGQLRSHPRGVAVLFLAEMWERFSFYGMRGLLIFYLTQHFLFDDREAATRYAAYATLVALTPLFGAVIADRLLGNRKAVAFGALLLVAGHLVMAVEGAPAHNVLSWRGQAFDFESPGRSAASGVSLIVEGRRHPVAFSADGGLDIAGLAARSSLPSHLARGDYQVTVAGRDALHQDLLFLALSLIVMGVGFMKTSPLLAQLYGAEDPRRDAGFTLYYYGVNLGAFWAGLLCGWLGEAVGWWAGFGAAALGMGVGYFVFVFGRPALDGNGEPPAPRRLTARLAGPVTRERIVYAAALAGVGVVDLLIRQSALIGGALVVVTLAALTYLAVHMARHAAPAERRRIGLALLLMLGAVAFWTLFQQAGTSLSLFAARNTALDLADRPWRLHALGQEVFFGTRAMLEAAHLDPAQVRWIDMGITAPQTQSFNPGFILLFAPLFAALWAGLGRRRADPPAMVKFGLALLQVGGGFLILVWGASFADPVYRTPLCFLVGAYLLHTTGELCLSPVGLSVVSRLAPPALVATLLAMWSLSSSWAQFLGGRIAALAASRTLGGKVLDPSASLAASITVFSWIGAVGIAAGVAFLALAPLVRRWDGPSDAGLQDLNLSAPEG